MVDAKDSSSAATNLLDEARTSHGPTITVSGQ